MLKLPGPGGTGAPRQRQPGLGGKAPVQACIGTVTNGRYNRAGRRKGDVRNAAIRYTPNGRFCGSPTQPGCGASSEPEGESDRMSNGSLRKRMLPTWRRDFVAHLRLVRQGLIIDH